MLRIIAIIKEMKQVIGYRLYDEVTDAMGNFNVEDSIKQLSHYGCSNAQVENGRLIGTECSLEKLTILDKNLQVVKNGGIIILSRIEDNSKTVGYVLIDFRGKKLIQRKDQAIMLMKQYGVSNASIITKGGKEFIRGIKKELPVIQASDIFNTNNTFDNIQLYPTINENGSKGNYDFEITIGNLSKAQVDYMTRLNIKEMRIYKSGNIAKLSFRVEYSIETIKKLESIFKGLKLNNVAFDCTNAKINPWLNGEDCELATLPIGKINTIDMDNLYALNCIREWSDEIENTFRILSLISDNKLKIEIQKGLKCLSSIAL